jgi:hypothetical protein
MIVLDCNILLQLKSITNIFFELIIVNIFTLKQNSHFKPKKKNFYNKY